MKRKRAIITVELVDEASRKPTKKSKRNCLTGFEKMQFQFLGLRT